VNKTYQIFYLNNLLTFQSEHTEKPHNTAQLLAGTRVRPSV